jgi:hypothetical protein
MTDCLNVGSPTELLYYLIVICCAVYRVNWMRARSQKHRWEEEFPRTEREMVWTTLYFMSQRDIWYSRLQALGQTSPGHAAYCQQKIWQWEEFSRTADSQFTSANPDYLMTWKPIVTPT